MGGHFDIEEKTTKISEIEKIMNEPNFWDDIDKANNLNKELTLLKKETSTYNNLTKETLSNNEILELLEIEFSEILLNENFMFKGAIVENYVAQAFIANNISLYYWNSGNKAEIDFLLYNKDGIIPVEVKADDNTKSNSLTKYINKYNPSYAIRISSKNFGFANNIKSVPLYATFLIK